MRDKRYRKGKCQLVRIRLTETARWIPIRESAGSNSKIKKEARAVSKNGTYRVPPDDSDTSYNKNTDWMYDNSEPKRKKKKNNKKKLKKKHKHRLYMMEEARKIKLKYDMIGEGGSATIGLIAKWLESKIPLRETKRK